MFFREKKENVEMPIEVFEEYNMKDIAYFDIETTGFSKENDKIILVSVGYFLKEKEFMVKQYFNENLSEEKDIICEFCNELNKFNIWCSYNGMAFDEPFIKQRIIKNSLSYKLPKKHIDLYRRIRPYYKKLGMSRCNLKTVEKYIGISRKDKIDGGISVELYEEYIKNENEFIRDKILLHNYEDVINLPKIFNIIYKIHKNKNITREYAITKHQLDFLNYLLKKNNLKLDEEIERISRRAASRMIDYIVKGNTDVNLLHEIINNSY